MPYVDEVCMGCGGAKTKKCPVCKGTGKCKFCTDGKKPDPHCNGTGEYARDCPQCHGTMQKEDGTPCLANHSCHQCDHGKLNCATCSGSCKCYECKGQGQVSCDDCNEKGTIAVWQPDPPSESYT